MIAHGDAGQYVGVDKTMADDEDGGVTVDQVKQEGGGKKPSKAKVVQAGPKEVKGRLTKGSVAQRGKRTLNKR